MLPSTQRLWFDEDGAVLSAELVLIVTILVLGLIVGLSCLQHALVSEFTDISRAFTNLNQSYFFRGFTGCRTKGAFYAGSTYYDVFENYGGCDYGYGYGGGFGQASLSGAYSVVGPAYAPGVGGSSPASPGAFHVESDTPVCPNPGQGPVLTPDVHQVLPQPDLKPVPNSPAPDQNPSEGPKQPAKPATAA